MQIDTVEKGNVTVVKISGKMDTYGLKEVRERFEQIIEDKNYKIIVDLSELNYINSLGLGMFISIFKRIRVQNGDLKFASLKSYVLQMFELTKLNNVFEFYPSVDEALKKFIQ